MRRSYVFGSWHKKLERISVLGFEKDSTRVEKKFYENQLYEKWI